MRRERYRSIHRKEGFFQHGVGFTLFAIALGYANTMGPDVRPLLPEQVRAAQDMINPVIIDVAETATDYVGEGKPDFAAVVSGLTELSSPEPLTDTTSEVRDVPSDTCFRNPLDAPDQKRTQSFQEGGHPGVDTEVAVGSPIKHMFCEGVVVRNEYGAPDLGPLRTTGPCGGNTITVATGRLEVSYLHLNEKPEWKVGDTITADDVLGLSGGIADGIDCTTGPHLHIEIADENGDLLDPDVVMANADPAIFSK